MPRNVDRRIASRLEQVRKRLGEAVLDPAVWPEIMEEICAYTAVHGAVLLQSDVRTADTPRTESVRAAFDRYFRDGWHRRDLRARGAPLLLRGQKVVTDEDVVTPEEMRRDAFFNECVYPGGLKWWAAVGFRAGAAYWALALQRTEAQGPFQREEVRDLASLADSLTETATLSTMIGRSVLSGTTDALERARQAAIAIGRNGAVRGMNRLAEELFDDDVRVAGGRLYARDKTAAEKLKALVEEVSTSLETTSLASDPIVARRRGKRPILIRACPIPAAAQVPFLDSRALLLLSDLGAVARPPSALLAQAFDLTPAETKLATLVAAGTSLEEAASSLGIARETARNQLKAIFAKTDTHRQGELVALLSKF